MVILAEVAPRFQPPLGCECGGLCDLPTTDFDEQHSVRSQPVERLRDEPSDEVEAISTAEQSSARFEVEGLMGQKIGRSFRDVGRHGREDRD